MRRDAGQRGDLLRPFVVEELSVLQDDFLAIAERFFSHIDTLFQAPDMELDTPFPQVLPLRISI